MECRLKCENPAEIAYTLTITMKARDWEIMREQLQSQWPSSELSFQINNLLSQARKIYWPDAVPA